MKKKIKTRYFQFGAFSCREFARASLILLTTQASQKNLDRLQIHNFGYQELGVMWQQLVLNPELQISLRKEGN